MKHDQSDIKAKRISFRIGLVLGGIAAALLLLWLL